MRARLRHVSWQGSRNATARFRPRTSPAWRPCGTPSPARTPTGCAGWAACSETGAPAWASGSTGPPQSVSSLHRSSSACRSPGGSRPARGRVCRCSGPSSFAPPDDGSSRGAGSVPPRASEPAVIVCRTLGPIEVTVDGEPAPPELLWRKHLALLVYLARSPRQTRSREHLTALLWADRSEAAARHSLSEALRVLRRHAGSAGVEVTVGQVGLAPGT